MAHIEEHDIGRHVECDMCGTDYTDSSESGGFIFGSHAYCPKCAVKAWPKIQRYHEESYVRAACEDGQSFADFVRLQRGDNNSIRIITLDEGESLEDL